MGDGLPCRARPRSRHGGPGGPVRPARRGDALGLHRSPSIGTGAYLLAPPAVTKLDGDSSEGDDGEWEPAGSSSAHYTARHGGLGVFAEVPMWASTSIRLSPQGAMAILEDARDVLGDLIAEHVAA